MAFATRPPFCVSFFHVTLIGIMVNGTGADLIRDCVNVNVTSCIGRYADIYDAFVSDENSYKIQAALYPPKNSSSVRVFVNLNVLNRSRTDASKENHKADVAEYTWSLKCLYAALPAYFLEILSLGSILVTPRTQKLNITIPHFCCNVSVEEREKWIEDVLAALQDIAVNPGLRDPTLNTAECVIKGHIPNITATGRGDYIRAVLWCPPLCVIMLIPILTLLALDTLTEAALVENDCKYCSIGNTQNCLGCFRNEEKPLIRSAIWFCYLLMILEASFVFAVVKSSSKKEWEGVPSVFYGTLSVIAVECLLMTIISLKCCTAWGITMHSCNRFPLIVCITLGVYHLCWVAIGIMINPTWGLSIFLIISFSSVALFFVIHEMSNVDYCKSFLFLQRCGVASFGFVGICLAFSAPVLVGQSFYGRETADDILKIVLLFVMNAVMVLTYKSRKPPTDASQCLKAAKEAAATAKALVDNITIPQPDGTEVDAVIAAAAKATSSAASATATAAEAVAAAEAAAVALAAATSSAASAAAAAAKTVTVALAKTKTSNSIISGPSREPGERDKILEDEETPNVRGLGQSKV